MLMILGSMQQVGSDGIDGFTNLSGTTSFGFSSSEIQSDVLRHRRHQQLVLASLNTPSLHQMLVFFILEGIMHGAGTGSSAFFYWFSERKLRCYCPLPTFTVFNHIPAEYVEA